MLISSIRVGSRCWYQVFGSGQNVGIETRPGGQSILCETYTVNAQEIARDVLLIEI